MSNENELLIAKLKANREKVGGYRKFAETCSVGESWLYKFVQGRIPNPSYRLLNAVREGLSIYED